MSEPAAVTRPLRIVFAARWFPATSQTFILRQVIGLLDLGHDVRVLSDRWPRDPVVHGVVRQYDLLERVTYVLEPEANNGRELASVGRLLLRRPTALKLLAHARDPSEGGPALALRLATLRRLRALAELGDVDVLHCHFGNVGLRYAPVAAFLGIPLLTSFYGYDCSSYPLRHGPEVYASLFRMAGGVTVLSDEMRGRLLELGCEPGIVHEHHLGVKPDEFPFRERVPPPAGQPTRLLTVARLVEKKGVELALVALGRVLSQANGSRPNIRYDIIGDGPLRDSLQAKAVELGLGPYVHFHGSQDQEQVRRYLAEAHLFVLPSLTASDGDQEGTPTVLVEASCTGLPVLSTYHSGIPEVIVDGRTGFLVPEKDVDALTDRLTELLDRPELWGAMGREGRRHVEARFDVRKLNRQLASVYEQLAGISPLTRGE